MKCIVLYIIKLIRSDIKKDIGNIYILYKCFIFWIFAVFVDSLVVRVFVVFFGLLKYFMFCFINVRNDD